MSRPFTPRLPLLLVLLLILLLVLAVWPSGEESANPAEAARSHQRGDADGVGDTIRTLTARVAEFQRELEALRERLDESRAAREELARRIVALEQRPSRAKTTTGVDDDSLDGLDRTIDRLDRFARDPLATTPPAAPEMPVGFGFDPLDRQGSRWVGPAFRDTPKSGIGALR